MSCRDHQRVASTSGRVDADTVLDSLRPDVGALARDVVMCSLLQLHRTDNRPWKPCHDGRTDSADCRWHPTRKSKLVQVARFMVVLDSLTMRAGTSRGGQPTPLAACTQARGRKGLASSALAKPGALGGDVRTSCILPHAKHCHGTSSIMRGVELIRICYRPLSSIASELEPAYDCGFSAMSRRRVHGLSAAVVRTTSRIRRCRITDASVCDSETKK